MNTLFTARITRSLLLMFMAAAISLLAACGGDDPAPPPAPVNQNPSGLYKTGTGTLGGVAVTDMVGFVHNNRIMAFSIAAHVLIDGSITNVSVNSYTATVNVYTDGVIEQTGVALTGSVTNGSQITGSYGTGLSSGNFSLTYDSLYTRGATNARINTGQAGPYWGGPVMMSINAMAINDYRVLDNNFYDFNSFKSSPTTSCPHSGTITIPSSANNIYTLSESINESLSTYCDSALSATDYTGFAAIVDGAATDDTLLYAITNATHAVFAVLTH